MDELMQTWLRKVGEKALRKLWAYAAKEDAPISDKLKIWQFMAEMAFGKAGTMERLPAKTSGGLIILPAVPGYDDADDLTV